MLFLVCLFVVNFLLYVKERDHLSFLEKVERHFQQKQERNVTFPHQPEGLSDVLFRSKVLPPGTISATI